MGQSSRSHGSQWRICRPESRFALAATIPALPCAMRVRSLSRHRTSLGPRRKAGLRTLVRGWVGACPPTKEDSKDRGGGGGGLVVRTTTTHTHKPTPIPILISPQSCVATHAPTHPRGRERMRFIRKSSGHGGSAGRAKGAVPRWDGTRSGEGGWLPPLSLLRPRGERGKARGVRARVKYQFMSNEITSLMQVAPTPWVVTYPCGEGSDLINVRDAHDNCLFGYAGCRPDSTLRKFWLATVALVNASTKDEL